MASRRYGSAHGGAAWKVPRRHSRTPCSGAAFHGCVYSARDGPARLHRIVIYIYLNYIRCSQNVQGNDEVFKNNLTVKTVKCT